MELERVGYYSYIRGVKCSTNISEETGVER